jgi:hypothetical protein
MQISQCRCLGISMNWLSRFALALLTFACAQTCSTASADEIREYQVVVKDKPVGNVTIRIDQAANGATVARTDTTVEAEFLLIKYHYEFHDQEIWNGDQLVQLQSNINKNGRPLTIAVTGSPRDSNIQVQGQAPRIGPPVTMTENYWRLPSAAAITGNFYLLQADTGAVRVAGLKFVGLESINIQGQPVACNHFRVTGDATADLWFDGENRMVRQQTVEQGYPTEIRMVQVRRGATPGSPATLAGYQN